MTNTKETTHCYLCLNPATYRTWDRDPDDPKAKEYRVCGLHSNEGDERTNR